MDHAAEMLQAHPHGTQVEERVLAGALDALKECGQTCTACADACLGEEQVQTLVRCIRLNLDCADICQATLSTATRQTEPDWRVLRAQLQACVTVCQECGDECEKHAAHHEHCRVCADSCRRCAEACDNLLSALPA